ncbi:MAG: sigma factor-like helix-turn-helix DNA-binding protein, partial [Actinomycetota bacterium]
RVQRQVVALYYLMDLSVADVAASLGVANGTVKTHLHRGRTALRAALQNTVQQEGGTRARS